MNLRENWTMIDFHELPTFFMVKTHVLHHLQAALFVDASDDAQVEVDDGALTEMPLGSAWWWLEDFLLVNSDG